MRDWILEQNSEVAQRRMPFGLIPVITTTKRPFAIYPLPCNGVITGLDAYCSVKAGTVTIDGLLSSAGGADGPITDPALAINATAAKYQVGAFSWRRAGQVFNHAAQLAQAFTGTETVTVNTFGVWLVQITDAGVLSTKPAGATMAYTTAALAIAALPAPDASNAPVGYILVAPTAGTFTAGTTALTTIGTFVDPVQADVRSFVTSITPLAGNYVVGVLSTSFANIYGQKGDTIVLACSGDGSAALTDGRVVLAWRPYPLKGEAGR